MFKDLYDALPPMGQTILTVVLIVIGAFGAYRGLVDRPRRANNKEKGTNPDIPMAVLVGPVHDAFQSIHGMAEEVRTQTAIERDMDKTLNRIDAGQYYTHRLLEAILRAQEMPVPPPPPLRPFRQNPKK